MCDELDRFYEDSERLDDALISDLAVAKDQLVADDNQFNRRAYCRCLLALFEGVAENLKQYSLQFADGLLGDEEQNLLRRRLGALEGAFHAFDLYTNVAGAKTPFARDSEEWLVLKKAIKIRNRITHPKSAEDLELSALDMVHLRATAEVVFDVIINSHFNTARALKKRGKMIQAFINKKTETEQTDALNHHAFGTFGTSAAEQPLVPKASGGK